MATSIESVKAQFHALGQQAIYSVDGNKVKATFNVGDEMGELEFCRDRDYTLHEVKTEILRQHAKLNPAQPLDQEHAPHPESPDKDKERMKTPQPGAHVEPGEPATASPIAKDPNEPEKLPHDEAFAGVEPANSDQIHAVESQQQKEPAEEQPSLDQPVEEPSEGQQQ